ncbi:hypothetical protein MBANPS3_008419 [Mucor bainieri]
MEGKARSTVRTAFMASPSPGRSKQSYWKAQKQGCSIWKQLQEVKQQWIGATQSGCSFGASRGTNLVKVGKAARSTLSQSIRTITKKNKNWVQLVSFCRQLGNHYKMKETSDVFDTTCELRKEKQLAFDQELLTKQHQQANGKSKYLPSILP